MYDYVKGKKCQFFYNLLLSKKFVKPHLEKKWCEFSTIESDMVKMIYTQKVINIKYPVHKIPKGMHNINSVI